MLIGNGSPVISGYRAPSTTPSAMPFAQGVSVPAPAGSGNAAADAAAQRYSNALQAANPVGYQPPAASGGGGGGGGAPSIDYGSLIANDPVYLQLQSQLSAQGIQNAAQRAAATQQALIQFGMVPSLNGLGLSQQQLNFLGQDITPGIAALAQQNTANGISTEARLQQAQQQALLHIKNALAARGLLSSGETNYQLANNATDYARTQSDAVQSLLQAIAGYQNQYLSNQQSISQQLQQALEDAANRQASLAQNQYAPPPAPEAPAPAAAPSYPPSNPLGLPAQALLRDALGREGRVIAFG